MPGMTLRLERGFLHRMDDPDECSGRNAACSFAHALLRFEYTCPNSSTSWYQTCVVRHEAHDDK